MDEIEGLCIALITDPLRDELETRIFDHEESCHAREYEKERGCNSRITEDPVKEVDRGVEFHDPCWEDSGKGSFD